MNCRSVVLSFTIATVVLSVGSAPAQSFTPTTNQMTSPRVLHTATLLDDGRVLITGGFEVSTAEIFDPSTGSPSTDDFIPTGSPVVARSFHTATRLSNGNVLITGGEPAFGSGALQSAEIFNPTSGTFSLTTGSMGAVRSRHTATLFADGTVLVAGGEGLEFGLLDTAEIFDPTSGSFRTVGEMTVPRGADHTATLLGDNTVLLLGGRQPDPPFTILTADLYNPMTGTFIEANGLMPGARNFQTATLLSDGTVLIAGGQIAGQINTFRAAIYEVTTEVFSETARMKIERGFHKATLLLDGTVLITGGFASFTRQGNPILSSAEVFTP